MRLIPKAYTQTAIKNAAVVDEIKGGHSDPSNPFITMYGNLKTDVSYTTPISYLFREMSILSESYL